jgi:hypothetical protein
LFLQDAAERRQLSRHAPAQAGNGSTHELEPDWRRQCRGNAGGSTQDVGGISHRGRRRQVRARLPDYDERRFGLARAQRRQLHLGWINNTHFWVDPKRGVGVIYLTQVLPFYNATSMDVMKRFEKTDLRALN